MNRLLAVNRARFNELFELDSWTGGNVVQKNVYMSKVEFSEVMVRHHLGRFLAEHGLNYRSPLYRFHIIMVPEVMDDEVFKAEVVRVLNVIGVDSHFNKTCNRGQSSYVVGKVQAREVELIEYCDIVITGRVI